jgi:hypothetical protein
MPKLNQYQSVLSEYLTSDKTKPKMEQRTAIVLFEDLQRQGFEGGYDEVRQLCGIEPISARPLENKDSKL